jgi:hypothetical protein
MSSGSRNGLLAVLLARLERDALGSLDRFVEDFTWSIQ